MDRNTNLYKAAAYCLEAARSLKMAGEDEYKETILRMGEEILNKIEVDEGEVKKIEEYERKIKEKING